MLDERLCAVAVMHVPVDDQDALRGMDGAGVVGTDGDVAEQTKAHRRAAKRMMPGGRTAQKLRRGPVPKARSMASSTAPAPAVAASQEPSLTTVSASSRPPPDAAAARTWSM